MGTRDTAVGLLVVAGRVEVGVGVMLVVVEGRLNHNTCFILCAVRGTSLLPRSETRAQTDICSLALCLHNDFLKMEGEE